MEIEETSVGDQNYCSRSLKIVHISDTHTHHDLFLPHIPDGDILIHSGDFSKISTATYFKPPGWRNILTEANNFFGKLPHEHKIFVAGNHELTFDGQNQNKLKDMFTNAHYLCDDSVILEGIKFYGSPWTAKRWTSFARGFSRGWGALEQSWEKIPKDTDVLVTHMPPYGILDLAPIKFNSITKFFRGNEICDNCSKLHSGLEHRGCKRLREVVFNHVRPKCHLFGHVHERNNFEMKDDIVFSNGALAAVPKIHVINYHIQ